jgi:hypothetical protein
MAGEAKTVKKQRFSGCEQQRSTASRSLLGALKAVLAALL